MTFGIDGDLNRIASIDLQVRVLWDARQACIALRFGNAEPERWGAIADNGPDLNRSFAEAVWRHRAPAD